MLYTTNKDINEELVVMLKDRYQRRYSARVEIGLVLTKKCPVGCRHCINNSKEESFKSPNARTYRNWIKKVSEVGIYKAVNITGGEPFAVFKKLLDITNLIREYGMYPTVLTSAYWANDEEVTKNKIKQLVNAGLYAISVSVDEFHQEKIPLENVARVLQVSKSYELKVGLSLTYYNNGENSVKVEQELRNNLDGNLLEDVEIIKGGIIKAGRARHLLFPKNRDVKENSLKICNIIGLIILQNGIVACCCGADLPENSPLLIGNLNQENFIDIYNRFEHHPLIPFIEVWGLTEMVKQLRAVGLGEDLEDYEEAPDNQICELCQKMLSKNENIEFFKNKFNDPDVKRKLGVKNLIMYGNPNLLLKGKN